MYIRAKRTNQTIFLYVESSETITDVRRKISAIIKTPVDNVRILSSNKIPLDDAKTLAESKIENDSVIYWVQKKEGLYQISLFILSCKQERKSGNKSTYKKSRPQSPMKRLTVKLGLCESCCNYLLDSKLLLFVEHSSRAIFG